MTFSYIKYPRWANEERTAVSYVIKRDRFKKELPSSASKYAQSQQNRDIFHRCASGEFGAVAAYIPQPPMPREIHIPWEEIPASWKGWPEMDYFLREANFENSAGSIRGIVVVWSSAIEFLLGSLLEMSERQSGKSEKTAKKFVESRWRSLGSKTTECLKRKVITSHDAEICKWVGVARNKVTHEWKLDLQDISFSATFLKAVRKLYELEHSELYEWNDHDLLFITRSFYAGSCGTLSIRLAEKRFHMSENL